MDGWNRDDPSREPGSTLRLTAAPPATSAPRTEDDETVFTIIAARARSHEIAHLVLTAVIGFVDAAAIGWAHPTFWPVALLFAAAGAYGTWGLLDRAVSVRSRAGRDRGPGTDALRILRETVALLGIAAVVAAAGGLFATQFDGWIS